MSVQRNETVPVFGEALRRELRGPAERVRPRGERLTAERGFSLALFTDFTGAEAVWRRFEEGASGTGFQSYDWLSAWHAHAGAAEGVSPAILAVSKDGAPVMLAPFGIERRMGLRCLVWLGGRLADYKAPLIAPDFLRHVPAGRFPALWTRMARALPPHDLVVLENQPALLGVAANPFVELGGHEAPDAGYVFALPATWDELAARNRPETRRMDRSKERRLAEQGELCFRIAATPGETARMTGEILERKARQLRAQGIASIFEEPHYRAAYRALAELPPGRRLLEVAELTLDGEFLSGSIAHVWHGRTTLMVHTYENGFAKFSPGRIHLLKLIRASMEAGISLYDLSVGHAPYKESFCPAPMPLYNHVAAAKPWGLAAASAERARFGLKRAIKANDRLMGILRSTRAMLGRK